MRKPKIFLAGEDHVNWAHDEGLRHARRALDGIVEFSSLKECDAVHATWWRPVVAIPRRQLVGKRVIAYTADDVFLRIISEPDHRIARQLIGLWVARNSRESEEFRVLGIRSVEIPLMVDTTVFRPIEKQDDAVVALCEQWKIPQDRYLIGSFQRDTEGRDLCSPKLKKGPDVFGEVVRGLHQRGYPIHVVLTGPRRYWLRKRLDELGVPFTFVGQTVQGDDIHVNTQPRMILNLLYNLVDLYLVSSRDEGAPNCVLEASAAGCKIVSTPVGSAPSILDKACFYRSVPEAVELIAQDIADGRLDKTVAGNLQKIYDRHTPERVAPLFRSIYEGLDDIPQIKEDMARSTRVFISGSRVGRIFKRPWLLTKPRGIGIVVSIWNRYFKPPYGGANQFMKALGNALAQKGIRVIENTFHGADVHILQGNGFKVDLFLKHADRTPVKVIHRLDGPVHLYRGFDRDKDEEVFCLNRRFATASVVQSMWSLEKIGEMGYRPINPVLIYNASDPSIFYKNGRIGFDRNRKTRLITSAWSSNVRKGGVLYKFLDENLDWSRFEYTFVGRTTESFKNINFIPAVGLEKLADLMRQHDIYITASQNDPCSNALVEALSCGLPALYRNDGGHPELVGYGGLPFRDESDVLMQLDRLVENYETFQSLVAPPRMDEVAEKFLTLIREVMGGEWAEKEPLDLIAGQIER